MKKFITGLITGALITSGIFYFINKNNEDDQKENVAALLEMVQKGQARNNQIQQTINDTNSTLVVHSPVTIIIDSDEQYYYYRDKDCSKIEKAPLSSIKELLADEQQKNKDIMIIIKKMAGTTLRNSIDLLDAIGRAGIQPGHYAEMDLSDMEKNCIKNYKKD